MHKDRHRHFHQRQHQHGPPRDHERERERERERNQPPPTYPAVNPRMVSGRTLTRLVEMADPKTGDQVLDIASGPSYLALTVAPLVKQVFTTDITHFSIDEGRKLAREKQLENIQHFTADAESMPFREGTFSLVTSRIAAHHFQDVRRAMHEMARMVPKGGRVVIADTVTPADEEIDRFLNHLDHLHDPTHVRNYTVREWKVLFADAGLKLKQIEEDVVEDERGECLREWLGRTGAPPQAIRQATGLLVSAKQKIKEALSLKAERGELYFQIRRVVLAGEK